MIARMAKLSPAALDFFRAEGKRGGHAAAAQSTPEERSRRARKASKAAAKVRTAKARARKKIDAG